MRLRRYWPLLLAATVGCARPAPTRVYTGAARTARAYFEALIRQDWTSAYGVLDADSKAGCPAGRFVQLARRYRQGLGFEPSEVFLRACDERAGEAIAHVSLKGRAGASPRFRRDAVTLRRRGSGWAVVLPANFGQARPRGG
jgi:hypothetical protein